MNFESPHISAILQMIHSVLNFSMLPQNQKAPQEQPFHIQAQLFQQILFQIGYFAYYLVYIVLMINQTMK